VNLPFLFICAIFSCFLHCAFNIGGEDYKEISNELLTFDNDTSIQTIMVTIFEDNIVEDAEDFFLTITEHSRIVKRLDVQIMTSTASISINGKLHVLYSVEYSRGQNFVVFTDYTYSEIHDCIVGMSAKLNERNGTDRLSMKIEPSKCSCYTL
jgi:hypothetical protein